MFSIDDRLIFSYKSRGGVVKTVDPIYIMEMIDVYTGHRQLKDLFDSIKLLVPPVGWGEHPDENGKIVKESIPYEPGEMIIQEAMEAREILRKAVNRAFGEKPIEEDAANGITETQSISLYFALVDYLRSLKKSTDETLDGPPSTVSLDP